MPISHEIDDFIKAFSTGTKASTQYQEVMAKRDMYKAMSDYYKSVSSNTDDLPAMVGAAGFTNSPKLFDRNRGQTAPAPQPTQGVEQPHTSAIPFNRRIMAAESGGQDRDAQGNILTSPKGAQGRMQVMPTTQRDPGYGVRPASDDSPDELARVGDDYAAAMLEKYGGDERLAAAAYNAGPGRVDGLVAKHGDRWIDHAPEETQNYVDKVAIPVQGAAEGGIIRPVDQIREILAAVQGG